MGIGRVIIFTYINRQIGTERNKHFIIEVNFIKNLNKWEKGQSYYLIIKSKLSIWGSKRVYLTVFFELNVIYKGG